ncbi:MAG: outer membrane protein [Methyloligellaceae bacterium]
MKKFLARIAAAAALSAVSIFSVQTASAGGSINVPVSHPTIWSGFYVGGTIGLASAESEASLFGLNLVSVDDDAFAGGVHVGYNWQRGSIVYGVEADYSFTGIEYNVFNTEIATIDGLGSVRARLGYAVNDLLLFATAGFAWKDSDTIGGGFVDLDDSGYVLGAGAEIKFGQKYSFRGEVLHYSFENESIFNFNAVDVDTDITVVRTGLSVHF